ncbi:MAG: tRNA-(ms[2]io[6]A)-hydroxylase [Pseudomonadales bacterium]|nr:tRNA-(ms[2]io[6]A)-hydroxylase [Pseudomonadales bacterium]
MYVNANSDHAETVTTGAQIDPRLQYVDGLEATLNFLACRTPQAWLAQVPGNLPVLLVDHANCEKKAASTALNLLYKYVDRPALLHKLSRLAREELRHFEQVLGQMSRLAIDYAHLSPSRYAAGLRAEVATHEPAKLVDVLIVGAYIEARSCERFAMLVPEIGKLDQPLAEFYHSLLKSEARHFRDYLALAEEYAGQHNRQLGVACATPIDFTARVARFGELEAELVNRPDTEFRFHSGVPV